jgi:alkanesulfonate monooxygenase SsuD/methylene tetrahydromethanopterin reductase-like flavin-dependent oxidoreductase (luciferase family)
MPWSRSDRIAYPSHDSRTVLAAAAGATSRIGLATNILLGPAYPPTLLAKATASLASLSGGRFTLGLAPSGRADDYAVTGSDFIRRGTTFVVEAVPASVRTGSQR